MVRGDTPSVGFVVTDDVLHLNTVFSTQPEGREEALKLAEEIGVVGVAARLGMNGDTLYGWRSRTKSAASY